MSWDEDFGSFRRGGVEALSTRDLPQGHSLLSEIESHWRELKARSALLPNRADLDASRIAGALPHAFVLERAAPGVGRIRIAGRALSNLLGTEARGLPLSVFFTPTSRAGLRGWIERCFDSPALVDVPVKAWQGMVRPTLTGRLLLLPLQDRDGSVTSAVGGLFVDGPKRAPLVKFDLADAPARCEIVPRSSQVSSIAVSMPAARHILAQPRRPHLRLVVDNG